MLNFMEIRPVGSALIHADGRTDMKKIISTFFFFFCDYAKTPKNFKLHSGGSYSKRSAANSGTLLIVLDVLFVRRRVP